MNTETLPTNFIEDPHNIAKLISSGQDINAKLDNGRTFVEQVLFKLKENSNSALEDILILLLKNGGDINLFSDDNLFLYSSPLLLKIIPTINSFEYYIKNFSL
jgi:hypothetical protein